MLWTWACSPAPIAVVAEPIGASYFTIFSPAAIGRAAGLAPAILPDLDGRDRVVSFAFPAD